MSALDDVIEYATRNPDVGYHEYIEKKTLSEAREELSLLRRLSSAYSDMCKSPVSGDEWTCAKCSRWDNINDWRSWEGPHAADCDVAMYLGLPREAAK